MGITELEEFINTCVNIAYNEGYNQAANPHKNNISILQNEYHTNIKNDLIKTILNSNKQINFKQNK